MTAQQHAAAAGEVVAAAGAVSAVASWRLWRPQPLFHAFSGALEKRVELAVRGAAIVLHSLGERGGGERDTEEQEKRGGREIHEEGRDRQEERENESDRRSGIGGAAADGKGGKLWRHRHGT